MYCERSRTIPYMQYMNVYMKPNEIMKIYYSVWMARIIRVVKCIIMDVLYYIVNFFLLYCSSKCYLRTVQNSEKTKNTKKHQCFYNKIIRYNRIKKNKKMKSRWYIKIHKLHLVSSLWIFHQPSHYFNDFDECLHFVGKIVLVGYLNEKIFHNVL